MSTIPMPPNLPVYDKPKEFVKATLPEAVPPSPSKPPGIMSKMITRMMKLPKQRFKPGKLKTKFKKKRHG